MKIGVTSLNDLKINAVTDTYLGVTGNHEIIGYKTNSNVLEQPVESETLQGARNRLLQVLESENDLDIIVSIENGIFEENKAWVDRAVIVIYDIKENIEHIVDSDPVNFETCYVDEARKVGFNKITVGQVMEDAGYVQDAKNPHEYITGKSRQEYIKEALTSIINLIEK